MSSSRPSRPTASKAEVADFYDTFSRRLIDNYIKGNPRIEAAIQRVIGCIGQETRSILDIGCGIGWSSDEYANYRDDISVLGVDISPKNIEIAERLFKSPRVEFRVSDMANGLDGQKFDLIALLDVFEHFPESERSTFSQMLRELLSPHGTVVLTTPSPLHQQWLADNDPGGLQVVDETIRLADLCTLADDIDCEVVHFESVGIWNTNDYFHTVLQREPRYEKVPKRRRIPQPVATRIARKARHLLGLSAPNEKEQRRRRVEQRLGIDT